MMVNANITPPALARRYGVSAEKIIGWIRSGELRAVNVAAKPSGRPRWRISESDIEHFEVRRAAVTTKTTRRRRKPAAGIIEFF